MRVAAAAALAILAGCAGRTDVSRGVEATWGLDRLERIAADPQNLTLPILKCQLDGFVEDVSEYRAPAVRRRAANPRIVATVPAAGVYYPAFIFYDGPAEERIGIFIDGAEAGTALANANDNRQYLFFLSRPRAFQGGEKVELRALTETGLYRTENLLLLKQKPEARRHDYAFSDIRVSPSESGEAAAVTWITSWPAACTVEWRGSAGGTFTEELPVNNHRVELTGLRPGLPYEFRLRARTREGDSISSSWQPFEAKSPAPPESRGRGSVSLITLEAGAGFPATVGVPFPKGALAGEDQLRLREPGAGETTLQTRTLARWEDGSLKWALLDWQPSRPGRYTLEYGKGVGRAPSRSPLAVTETPETVRVETGPLRFTLDKARSGFLDSVELNGVPIVTAERPAAFHLTGPDGTVYSTLGRPDQVVVEERGPLRAVVRVSGRHLQSAGQRKLFAYTLRIHAYAGRSFLRIQHTFGNDVTESEFTAIKSLKLRLPLSAAGGPLRWAMAEGAATPLKQRTAGPRAAGWAEWSDGRRTVTLALRHFWQNYPKDLAVSAGGFELGLCPDLAPDEYAFAKGTIDEHRLFYYLQDGVYKLRQGMTKTHDLWLDFAPGAQPSPVRAQRAPLVAAAPAQWYASSGVFGELAVPRSEGLVARYDAAFDRSYSEFLAHRERNREYGMLNFGDWWGERAINWGNSEYDTQHSFLLEFARTGQVRYFRAGEEAEWHNRDIDTVHYHSDPALVGGVYAHAIGHSGDYYRQRPAGFKEGSPRSHMAADHTFVEGHLDYWFLTGDRRSLDTARAVVDRYARYHTRDYDFNNCRQPGWQIIMSMAMHQATNDPFYLNAARIIVERVLERQTAEGGWKRQMVPGHCFCTPRHQGNAGFMVGVLLTGLKRYYQATGDERVAAAIVKGAHFLIDSMWVPEVKGFRYTSCPKSNAGPSYNFRLFDGIVFAHQRTQDPRLREVLLAGTEPAVAGMGGFGKGFTQQTRVTPHFIDYLVALRRSPRPTDRP